MELDKLAAALVAFQGEVPVIPKNRTAKIPTKNGGSYSYKYADLTDMWEAIRPILHKHGLAVTQPLASAETLGCIGIRTIVWHESGQRDESLVEFPAAGKTPQEVGSAVTYYKRYALGAALGIATDEDDDGAAATHSANQSVRNGHTQINRDKPQSEADVKRGQLKKLAAEKGWSLKQVAEAFEATVVDGSPDLKSANAGEVEAFIVGLETGVITI